MREFIKPFDLASGRSEDETREEVAQWAAEAVRRLRPHESIMVEHHEGGRFTFSATTPTEDQGRAA